MALDGSAETRSERFPNLPDLRGSRLAGQHKLMKLLRFLPLLFILVALGMATDVTITTKSLPNGTVDKSYSGVIKADDGCTPYEWTFVAGRLPTGVKMKVSSNTTALDLSGSPTAADGYGFTVSVRDCKKHVSKKWYKVTIQKSSEHVVDLSWKGSSSKDVAGYNVYRGPNGTKWTKVNAELIGSTIYDDSSVANGSTYFYAITAVGTDGEESAKTPAVKVEVP